MARLRTSRLASLGVLLSVCLMGSAFGQERFTRTVRFDIAAQSVEAALLEFSKQADVQVMVGTSSLNGQKTEGVKGKLAVKDALRELLKNTGLEYQTEGNSTITIRSAVAAAKTDAQVRPLVDGTRLASRDATGEAASRGQDSSEGESRSASTIETLDEVVVTGTHIKGAPPVGRPLIVIDSTAIERTGHATVQDIVHDLPQNFLGGGANESTNLGGGPVNVNASAGSSINLRGLGAGSTLVLVNGRRLAPAGTDASFLDVSALPASAIDRIEVLLDGASATYGADAVGGVVNVILKRSYSGAVTQAQVGVPTQGNATEYRAAQTLGGSWSSGHAVVSYEYWQRDDLPAADRDGTRTQDLRSFGGSDFRGTRGNPGTIVIGAQTWAIPVGQDGSSLTPASFSALAGTRNLYNVNETRDVLPDQKRHSAFASIDQVAGENINLNADVLFSQRDALSRQAGLSSRIRVPATNGFYVNPTGGTGPVSVDYNFAKDLGGLDGDLDVTTYFGGAGATVSLPHNWESELRVDHGKEKLEQVTINQVNPAALSAALADSNRATAFNPFGDGSNTNQATLDSIRGSTRFETESEMSGATVTTTGPIWALPAGNLSLAAGMEFRTQEFATNSQLAVGSSEFDKTDSDRDVRAAFVEFRVPLFGGDVSRTALARLNLSAAARYERYSDFGSATTPALALEWAPVADVAFRVSRTKSFKAPSLPRLDEGANVLVVSELPDPQSATGTSPVLFWAGGGNADLDAEHSESWTAGLDWHPSFAANTRMSLTYFDTEFQDRIQSFATQAATFLLDSRFADAVIRDPTTAQRAAVCSRATFLGAQPSDCIDAPIAALIDLRPRNSAITKQQGIDLLSSHELAAAGGNLALSLNATYFLKFEEALTRFASPIDLSNQPFQPVDFRALGSMYWTRGAWGVGTTARYVDGYRDTISVPNREIASWVTADFQIRYEGRDDAAAWLQGLSVALNIENAFDREPPFFNNAVGIAYDPTNASPLGRIVSLQLRKNWSGNR